jgi:hypothetical protein
MVSHAMHTLREVLECQVSCVMHASGPPYYQLFACVTVRVSHLPCAQVGIKEGGRTGLVAITVAACFGVSLFFAPILQVVAGQCIALSRSCCSLVCCHMRTDIQCMLGLEAQVCQ